MAKRARGMDAGKIKTEDRRAVGRRTRGIRMKAAGVRAP